MKEITSSQQKRMYYFLLLLIIAATMGLQGWRTLFNNYAVDKVGIDGFQMGVIQSIREVPGFLTFLIIFLLLFFKEHRLSTFSVVLIGIGVILTGLFPSFWGIIITTFIFSTGFHFFETTNRSLTLQYFSLKDSPIILGKQQSWKAVTNIVVGLVIIGTSQILSLQQNFLFLGITVVILGCIAFFYNPIVDELPVQQKKMVVKKKYWLFYVLNFLSGARRQVFTVFAVFMLVEQYHFSVLLVTVMFIINNIVTFFTAPLIAKGINRYGERLILTLEYAFMIVVFLGYAFVKEAWVIALLYVIDNLFYNCSIGINTFYHKIGEKQDIAPTMAVGFTINHISAVVIPVIGGALWILDYQLPFLIGTVLAIVSLVLVQYIPSQLKKNGYVFDKH